MYNKYTYHIRIDKLTLLFGVMQKQKEDLLDIKFLWDYVFDNLAIEISE